MHTDNEYIKRRLEKISKINALNLSAYPTKSARTHKISCLVENEATYIENEEKVVVAGRIKAMRRMGKTGFGNIADDSGNIQFYVRIDNCGAENYEVFKLLDLGDFVQFAGEAFRTQKGQYSVKVSCVTLLAKSIRPLPTVKEREVDGKIEKYDEFSDIELRYRKRYLDLLLNEKVKTNFVKRAQIITSMRTLLDERGFLEVETPVLQSQYGGANARPFTTHHNTLDMPLYLRIATELYLKRLIVGGIERVYEIGKNFRNEGMDRTHNPEFTLIELYQSFADYNDMMDITEDLVINAAEKVLDGQAVEYSGHTINLQRPWRRATMLELVKEYSGYDASDFDLHNIRAFMDEKKIEYDEHVGAGKLITELFDIYVESKLIQPVFVTDFPKEVSPLAKANPEDNNYAERFELYVAGAEMANAFTELNDPIDQRERLEAQAKLREMGDVEANTVDEDFLEAIEYGMPPTGGLGIGVDRLVMLLTGNESIKEVILFPQMKPEK